MSGDNSNFTFDLSHDRMKLKLSTNNRISPLFYRLPIYSLALPLDLFKLEL